MLTQAVMTYLAVRRATGFALRCESFQLKSFAAFSEARGKRQVESWRATQITDEQAKLILLRCLGRREAASTENSPA